jgi:two-component system nitrate/nitrite response regulator NarL
MRIPLIVTHPSTLLHAGLRRAFTKSLFGPLFIAPELSEKLESQMRSLESCIWLIGVRLYDSTVNDLMRRVTTDAPGVKPVIFAAYHAPDDIVAAQKAGACGFLCQDISAEQLSKSLELITLGQAVVPRDCPLGQVASGLTVADCKTVSKRKGIDPDRLGAENSSGETSESDLTRSLSRRELLILRMLTEGASNKVIALKLVITESTVKVHMKAILRKLRLENRTQAAMWARNHIDEDVWIGLSNAALNAGGQRRDGVRASPSVAC